MRSILLMLACAAGICAKFRAYSDAGRNRIYRACGS